ISLTVLSYCTTPLFLLCCVTAIGRTTSNDISCLNDHKYVQQGEIISLNCKFSAVHASVAAWFKQTPGENPLLIVSAFHTLQEKYHNGFNKSGRFNAVREKNNFIFSFNLKISNAESSDSATYYCIVAYHSYVALFHCTPPVSDPVQLGGNTTLQCSILTDNSAGDHSVYWFRHGSGESDPGIIFTHGNRSDQCKKSSETVSPTQSCIYKLPKNNLSLSDAGTYYCAVAACGHIFFGNGTKLDLIRAQASFISGDFSVRSGAQSSFSAEDFRCRAESRQASARDILGAERSAGELHSGRFKVHSGAQVSFSAGDFRCGAERRRAHRGRF
uniref:Ig-like domain-containing protein n=1 Tax=Astyanax mexicanus TaxID=7994 RepID=A0A3B1JGN9_ASTMX